MGVSSTANRILYAGNGLTTSFNFPYYFFNQVDLGVAVYSTTLGTITSEVLNTDYTISGTPNAQGLYQNGANVVLSVAPAVGEVLVIYRNPSEVQEYALLQNGQINSAALVQQFDYVTLLIQRLEDQIARCIQIPDGAGITFDGNLPSDIALLPGNVPTVNPAGDGWVLSEGSPFVWTSQVVSYSSVQTAGTSNVVSLFNLPAGFVLMGLNIKHSTVFAGTSITDVKGSIGITGDASKFILDFDLDQSVSDSAFELEMPNYIASWASDTAINLRVVSTGANLSALSQGSVVVSYLMMGAV